MPRHGLHSDKAIERALADTFKLFVGVREINRGREESGKGVGLGTTQLSSGVITAHSGLMGCNHLKGISFLPLSPPPATPPPPLHLLLLFFFY